MEPLRRSLMLLKPGDGFKIPHGKNGGTLKLLQDKEGAALSLSADCLGEGDYFLYLFTSGKELYAGDIRDGALNTALPGVRLEDVVGAAVVRREGSGEHSFCLKSPGEDWPSLMWRFRTARTALREETVVPYAKAGDIKVPETRSYEDQPPQIVTPYDKIPQINIEDDDIPKVEAVDTQDMQSMLAKDITDEVLKEAEKQDAAEHTEPGFEETGCDDCPRAQRETKINPFPSLFPNSEWIKISYPGPTGWWHYISGSIYKGGTLVAKALGVPGEYGMAPPIWLEGFGTYLRCFTGDARGYWLMFQDAETGEVLDMGLSPHGA